MDQPTKVRENRLRRAAKRQGLKLQKSKRRDPRAYDYGGWWLIDLDINGIAYGDSNTGMSLDEAEEILTGFGLPDHITEDRLRRRLELPGRQRKEN